MKKVLAVASVLVLVGAFAAPAMAQGLTKAEYRAGKPFTPPVPKAGTDDCTAPTTIPSAGGAVDFMDTGDTDGSTDTVNTIPLACNGLYSFVEGPDHIYTFDILGAGNSLTFTTTTTDNVYDMSIYMLSTCGDANSCVIGADNCLARDMGNGSCAANDSEESFTASDLAAGTYYFYVDSYYLTANDADRASGPYTLTVTGTVPAELIKFSVD